MFKAKEENVKFLSNVGIARIPFFQRRYVWDEQNWSDFYDSLFGDVELSFLGSIIMQSNNDVHVSDERACSIIDGQQRLTTISIFLMCLYNHLSDEDKDLYGDGIKDILFRIEDGKRVPRILHSRLDRKCFEKVITLDSLEFNADEVDNKIIKCYNYFTKRMDKESKEDVKTTVKKLLESGNNDIFVVISIDEDADEQRVFDTLNTAGVRLTIADTVKNFLYGHLRNFYDSEESVVDCYKNTWERVFEKTEDLDRQWNLEFNNGRIKSTNIENFLYCFAIIKGFYQPGDKMENLNLKYKEKITSIHRSDNMNFFLEELMKFAKLYYANFIDYDLDADFEYSHNNVLSRLLLWCQSTETKTFYPLILFLIEKFSNDNQRLNNELHKLEKLLILNELRKDDSKIKNYNKVCVEYINDLNKLDKSLEDALNPENSNGNVQQVICQGLENIKTKKAKALLYMIEAYRRCNSANDITYLSDYSKYEVEHIMPKKWNEHWNTVPVVGYNNQPIPFEERDMFRNEAVENLGNMTLLKGKLNKKIRNMDFATKVEGTTDRSNGKEIPIPGYIDYTDFKITKKDIVDKYNNGTKVWNEYEIGTRQFALYKDIEVALLY